MNVLVTAFTHPENDTFTIVAINRYIADKTVRVDINNYSAITSMEAIRTSSSEKAVRVAQFPVQGNVFTVTLPKESITTFVYADPDTQKRTKGAKIRR
jgi:O-glycosyl hydrolase